MGQPDPDTIKCLICGRALKFLPPHLRRAHGLSADEYRVQYDLPAGLPLAGESYREVHRRKMARMHAAGALTYDHLPRAVEASRSATDRPKRGASRIKQIATISATKPWEVRQLPPGAKRADGRDADRAREYQRKRRANKPRCK